VRSAFISDHISTNAEVVPQTRGTGPISLLVS
jgi:hypothetical protein